MVEFGHKGERQHVQSLLRQKEEFMDKKRSEGLKEFLDPILRDSPEAFCLLVATVRFRRAFRDSSKEDSDAAAKKVAVRRAEFLRAGFSEEQARQIIDFVVRKDTEGGLEDLEQKLATKEG